MRLPALLLLLPMLPLAAQTPRSATPPAVDCSRLNATPSPATMDHAAHQALLKACEKPAPTAPGQAAFGAISEIVTLLLNDPTTDWTTVNLEALRQHLIDMDDLTLRAKVTQRNVPGGLEAIITGTGSTAQAIRRMLPTHAATVAGSSTLTATVALLPNGARLTIVARNPTDLAAVARIRGLGFIGFMAEGDHHVHHHLAIARGDAAMRSHTHN